MTRSGAQQVERTRDTLICPNCQYSLRGLNGDEFNCPECGQHINVAACIAALWERPWHKAPLYNLLALPPAAVIFGFCAVPFMMFFFDRQFGSAETGAWLTCGVFIMAWIASLFLVRRKFGSMEGVWLSILLHPILGAYLLGIIWIIGGVISIVMYGQPGGTRWFYPATLILMSIGLILAARWGERFVAKRCIRRHLRIAAAGGRIVMHDQQ